MGKKSRKSYSEEVAIILADGFEEIEAVTVIDVLKHADLSELILVCKHAL